MTKTTKTYLVSVIERALGYYKIDAEDARSAAENWQEGDFLDRDDDALESEGPCNVRERQPDGTYRKLPRPQWDAESCGGRDAAKPYSVLLLYPDYANDSGTETYYTFVEAKDPSEAVDLAQRHAIAGLEDDQIEADAFAPLLVIEGHHRSEALFNK